MKDKKGYTLVELLAVVIILGILSSITAIAVINVKKKQDVNNFRNEISGILTGAKRYETEHPGAITPDGVMLSDLVNDGYTNADDYKKYAECEGCNDDAKETSGKAHLIHYEQCPDNIKRKFYIKLNGVEYNDCGCEQQGTSGAKAKKLCAIKGVSDVEADAEIKTYLKK